MRISSQLGGGHGRHNISPWAAVSRKLEHLEGIVDGGKEREEGEDIDERVELDVCQRRMFDPASGILLVFAGLREVLV